MPRFQNPIESQFAGEAAASLANSGRRLRRTLDALHRHDAEPRAEQASARAALIDDAADAFWCFVVHRETLGLVDQQYIVREYGVPAEVVKRMGPKPRRVTIRDDLDRNPFHRSL